GRWLVPHWGVGQEADVGGVVRRGGDAPQLVQGVATRGTPGERGRQDGHVEHTEPRVGHPLARHVSDVALEMIGHRRRGESEGRPSCVPTPRSGPGTALLSRALCFSTVSSRAQAFSLGYPSGARPGITGADPPIPARPRARAPAAPRAPPPPAPPVPPTPPPGSASRTRSRRCSRRRRRRRRT